MFSYCRVCTVCYSLQSLGVVPVSIRFFLRSIVIWKIIIALTGTAFGAGIDRLRSDKDAVVLQVIAEVRRSKCPPRQYNSHVLHLLCISWASALRHHLSIRTDGQQNDDSESESANSVPVPLHELLLIVTPSGFYGWQLSCKSHRPDLLVVKHGHAIQ